MGYTSTVHQDGPVQVSQLFDDMEAQREVKMEGMVRIYSSILCLCLSDKNASNTSSLQNASTRPLKPCLPRCDVSILMWLALQHPGVPKVCSERLRFSAKMFL